jgi:hypothetical protein
MTLEYEPRFAFREYRYFKFIIDINAKISSIVHKTTLQKKDINYKSKKDTRE